MSLSVLFLILPRAPTTSGTVIVFKVAHFFQYLFLGLCIIIITIIIGFESYQQGLMFQNTFCDVLIKQIVC